MAIWLQEKKKKKKNNTKPSYQVMRPYMRTQPIFHVLQSNTMEQDTTCSTWELQECTLSSTRVCWWMICRSVWAGQIMHTTVGSKSINQSNKQRWPQPGGIQISQSIIIVLSAVPSIQSTQHRPVCRDIYPSFLQGAITLQSPDLGYTKWNTTLPTSLFLYLSYSKLPVIESCSPGRTARHERRCCGRTQT